MKNHYRTLGVKTDATQEEIKKSYRKLAVKFHPDTSGAANASRFTEIQEAYQVLSNTQKRKTFDKFWDIYSREQINVPTPQQEYFVVKQDSSKMIIFATVAVIVATFLAIKFLVFTS